MTLPEAIGGIMIVCIGCKYLGKIFEHLEGYEGVKEWRACTCPVPFWVTPQAVPMYDNKYDCKCKVSLEE